MFNQQQSQGVLSPQMVHMQRLMANRPQRSSNFFTQQAAETQMGMPMELNDQQQQQYSQNIMHQRNFDGGIGAQPSPMMRGFANPNRLDNFPMASTGMMAGMGGDVGGGFIGSANARMPVFKCPECGIVKNSNEDLEIHIKTEHLGWLPFQCPICTALRASDIQMREHMHSHHKKNENKYIYVDNPQSKRILQEMMDRALFGASQQIQQQMARRGGAVHQSGGLNGQMMAKRPRLSGADIAGDNRMNSMGKRSSIGDEMVAHRQQQKTAANGQQQQEGESGGTERQQKVQNEMNAAIDEETDAQLSNIFGRKIKSEFDMAALDGGIYANDEDDQGMLAANEDEDDLPDDNSHQQMDALQNVAAMFSVSGGSDRGGMNSGAGQQQQNRDGGNNMVMGRRIVRNRPGPMTSKKRVLGLCGDCNKPITAGARQMHMFYHLGKDLDTYRFRCKHSGCPVQHYRKDQMENHQAKTHGKVDADMMEDRSNELYNLVQDMSLKLLGTTGNTPGPTAAKAQMMYDQQMREMEASFGVRKRRRPSGNGLNGSRIMNNNCSTSSNMDKHNPILVPNSAGSTIYDSANRRVENLECKLCNKFILNRIRGFHILWHLNNDLGIVRYGCKHCNFKHDRPQSVAAHGSREHGDEAACEDLLYNFESELKSMSKACFGVERLFEKEIRRRNKLERAHLNSLENSPSGFLDDDDSQPGSEFNQQMGDHRRSQQIANLKIPLKPEGAAVADRNWTQKEPVKKRRSAGRRFGTRVRRTMSRRARDVMVKLREVSMRLGGAQYIKKRGNEAVPCEKCGKLVVNRLSDHTYSHMEGCDLFRCKRCNLGHYSRETIVRHLKDFHGSHETPMDNRLRYAQEIKNAIRECYPRLFIDAPIPTKEDIEKMRAQLNLSDQQVLVGEKEEDGGQHKEEQEVNDERGEEEEEEEGVEKSADYDDEEEEEADNTTMADDETGPVDDEEEDEAMNGGEDGKGGGEFGNEEEEEEGEDDAYEDEEECMMEEEEEMEEEGAGGKVEDEKKAKVEEQRKEKEDKGSEKSSSSSSGEGKQMKKEKTKGKSGSDNKDE